MRAIEWATFRIYQTTQPQLKRHSPIIHSHSGVEFQKQQLNALPGCIVYYFIIIYALNDRRKI